MNDNRTSQIAFGAQPANASALMCGSYQRATSSNTKIIYRALLPSGKSYIGQTKDFDRRSDCHRHDADNGSQTHFHRAIRKYGWDSVVWIFVERVNNEDANAREQYWIAAFDSFDNGYNETTGGEGGYERSETTKRKISARISEVQRGRRLSASHKRKISFRFRGKPLTEEHKRKLSLAKKGRPARNKGVPCSEEQKRKISMSLRGNQNHAGHKHNEETKMKISRTRKENGYKHSEETKREISQSQKERYAREKAVGNV